MGHRGNRYPGGQVTSQGRRTSPVPLGVKPNPSHTAQPALFSFSPEATSVACDGWVRLGECAQGQNKNQGGRCFFCYLSRLSLVTPPTLSRSHYLHMHTDICANLKHTYICISIHTCVNICIIYRCTYKALGNSKISSHPLLMFYFCRHLIWTIRQISVSLLFVSHLLIRAKNTRNMLHGMKNT